MRPVKDAARGVVAVGRAEAPAGLVQMPVDSVLGEAQFAGDLLGAHVAIDQTKAFALTLGEALQTVGLIRQGVGALLHRLEPYANGQLRQAAGTLNLCYPAGADRRTPPPGRFPRGGAGFAGGRRREPAGRFRR